MCKKLDRASTYVFFRDLLLTLLGLSFYKKSCLKEREVCGKIFSNVNIVTLVTHTMLINAEMRMPAFQHIFAYTSCYSKGSIQDRNVQHKLTGGSLKWLVDP